MDNSCKQLNKIISCHTQKPETIQMVHPYKVEKQWQKHSSFQIQDTAFLYTANYKNI